MLRYFGALNVKQFLSSVTARGNPYFLKDNLVKLWKVSGFLPEEILEDIKLIHN